MGFYWLKCVCNYVITTLNVLHCSSHVVLGRYENSAPGKSKNKFSMSNFVDKDGKGRSTDFDFFFFFNLHLTEEL